MKKELINIIKIIGINLNEIVIDIKIGNITFNSIEFVEPDNIILHTFFEDLDIETNWENTIISQRKKIMEVIRPFLYN